MQRLHSCLCWSAKKKKTVRIVEDPTPEQDLILNAFGYEAVEGGLQKIVK
jgi:hypothetical protein